MAITREIWIDPIQQDYIPEWPCPNCKKSVLIGTSKDFHIFYNASTIAQMKEVYYEEDWGEGVFTAILTCSNVNCNEKVIAAGSMYIKEEMELDFDGTRVGYKPTKKLLPKYFIPAISVFNINELTPEKVKNAIIDSFKMYWVDTSSCANKIRIAIELILDQQKIPKTYLNKGKRSRYALHQRINTFKERKSEESDLLMAIKWIGNMGSHNGEPLTKDNILDGYEILEHVIAKLYEQDSKRIITLTKKINTRKRAIRKKKK